MCFCGRHRQTPALVLFPYALEIASIFGPYRRARAVLGLKNYRFSGKLQNLLTLLLPRTCYTFSYNLPNFPHLLAVANFVSGQKREPVVKIQAAEKRMAADIGTQVATVSPREAA